MTSSLNYHLWFRTLRVSSRTQTLGLRTAFAHRRRERLLLKPHQASFAAILATRRWMDRHTVVHTGSGFMTPTCLHHSLSPTHPPTYLHTHPCTCQTTYLTTHLPVYYLFLLQMCHHSQSPFHSHTS